MLKIQNGDPLWTSYVLWSLSKILLVAKQDARLTYAFMETKNIFKKRSMKYVERNENKRI